MKKISAFLSEVWREVHPVKGRVVWPASDKVFKSTKVVVIMSLIVALFVGGSDWAFGSIITNILF